MEGGGGGKEHGSMGQKENSRLGNVTRSTAHINFISDRLHCFLELNLLQAYIVYLKQVIFTQRINH